MLFESSFDCSLHANLFEVPYAICVLLASAPVLSTHFDKAIFLGMAKINVDRHCGTGSVEMCSQVVL
jgi:hypothetical protein